MLPSVSFTRPRVRELLRAATRRRAVLVCAPVGFGKSVALRDLTRAGEAVYLPVEADDSLNSFVGRLVGALSLRLPGLECTLAGAYERALLVADPPVALAGWFARHLGDEAITIAVDGVQRASDRRIFRFLSEAVERSPREIHWILAGESLDDLPVPNWLARGLAAVPLGERELRLTLAEAVSSAGHLAPGLDHERIATLHAATSGVPNRFALAAAVAASGSALSETEAGAADLAAKLFAGLERLERAALLASQHLPELDDLLVAEACGEGVAATLRALRRSAPYLFEPGGRRCHSALRAYVRTLPENEGVRAETLQRTAETLERRGDLPGAVRAYRALGNEVLTLACIERHGLSAIENNRAYLVLDAIGTLGDEARKKSPAVLTVLAISAALGGRLDMAEAFFQNALMCAGAHEAWRVKFWYGCELVRRGRGPEAVKLLQADEISDRLPAKLRVGLLCAEAAAHAIQDDLGIARSLVDRALRIAARLGDGTEKARAYHQASYVALRSGDYRLARKMALRAVAAGESAGAYAIAGSALSVLYNVVADVEEDPGRAAGVLRRIAACGAKIGSVENQLYALVGAYEIEIERGDTAAAGALATELRDFEVQYGAKYTSEGLLPAQTLQLAWRGEFGAAFRLLKPTTVEGLDPERRALRFGEIAVYAACAGEPLQARLALASCRRLLEVIPADRAQIWRARGYAALALVLLGHCAVGTRLARQALDEAPLELVRQRALLDAVWKLAGRRTGACDDATLLEALEDLRRRQLGGFARLLEALPFAGTAPLEPGVVARTA